MYQIQVDNDNKIKVFIEYNREFGVTSDENFYVSWLMMTFNLTSEICSMSPYVCVCLCLQMAPFDMGCVLRLHLML